jgi:hypothetical protein
MEKFNFTSDISTIRNLKVRLTEEGCDFKLPLQEITEVFTEYKNIFAKYENDIDGVQRPIEETRRQKFLYSSGIIDQFLMDVNQLSDDVETMILRTENVMDQIIESIILSDKINMLSGEGRISVIAGPNGVGKTRLSKQLEDISEDVLYIPATKILKNIKKVKSTTDFDDINDMIFELYKDAEYNTYQFSMSYDIYKTLQRMSKPSENYITEICSIWNRIFSGKSQLIPYIGETRNFKIKKSNSEVYFFEASDGEVLALFLIVLFAHSEKKLIIIDEFDTFMSNDLSIRLLNYASEHADKFKLVITSHNQSFIKKIRNLDIYLLSLNGNISLVDNVGSIVEILQDGFEKVVFVEGEKESLDYAFYSKIFSERKIIHCGSCEEVKKKVSVINSDDSLGIDAIGIIDRDNLTLSEIKKHSQNNIFVLKYRHIENLLCCEFLMDIFLENNMAYSQQTTSLKEFIKDLSSEMYEQISTEYKNDLTKKTYLNSIQNVINSDINFTEFDSLLTNAKNLADTDFENLINLYGDDKLSLILIMYKKKDFHNKFKKKLGQISYFDVIIELVDEQVDLSELFVEHENLNNKVKLDKVCHY